MWNKMKWIGSVVALGIAAVFLSGCGTAPPGQGGANPKPAETTSTANPGQDGWWCNEHGVPEGECALCSTKVAAEYKKKGDWCKEHGRPESQCFICHPELADKFATQYEAKYGKKPPAREQ